MRIRCQETRKLKKQVHCHRVAHTGAGRAKRPPTHAVKKKRQLHKHVAAIVRFRCEPTSRCTESLHVVGLSEPQMRLPTDRGRRRGGGLEAYVCQQCPTSRYGRSTRGKRDAWATRPTPQHRPGRERSREPLFALQYVSMES